MGSARVQLDELTEARLYAREHGLLDTPAMRCYERCLALQAGDDDFVRGDFLAKVAAHRQRVLFEGVFPCPSLDRGEEYRGRDHQGHEIRTPIHYRGSHTLRLAGSGSGKTNAASHAVLQVAPHVKGLWLIDMRKREFARLRTLLARMGRQLAQVKSSTLCINPLEPPANVSPQAYAPIIADTIVNAQELPPRCAKLLHNTLLKLYAKSGVLDGSKNNPTLFDLFTAVQVDRNANHAARMAFLDAMEPILRELGPEVLGYRSAWTAEQLAKQCVHFDFSASSDACKNFMLSVLLQSLFTGRIAAGVSNAKMDLYVAVDEAGDTISAKTGNSALLKNFTLVRGTGVGLDVGTTTADIHPTVLSNTSNKSIGRCGSANDYNTMASAMGLTAQQLNYIKLHLEPGMFCEQLGQGYRLPYLLNVPLLDLDANEASAAQPAALPNLTVVPASVPPEFQVTQVDHVVASSSVSPSSVSLTDAEVRYLSVIQENPGKKSSEYARLANMGNQLAQKTRNALIGNGLLRQHDVATGGRGRTAIVLEVTAKGVEALAHMPGPAEGA